MQFKDYVALGDSMSIDLYPALDAGEIDVAVALERTVRAGKVAPLGAAALFYKNADERYVEFTGNDLTTRYDAITYANLAEDGATIGDAFGSQLPQLDESDAPTLLTLSVGGNDLLSAFANEQSVMLIKRVVKDVAEAYEFLVESIVRARPNSLLVTTTIYDPSDGTRHIPGVFDDAGPLPLEALHDLNERIKTITAQARHATVADVHDAFLGHGLSAPEAERWYWKRSWIEPNALGASEIRRLWLDALDGVAED